MANATADAAGAEKEPPVDDTPDEAVFALIAEDYGLTRREAEVLPYLARGRSAKVIAEALFVSESTIRTHTRRIFEKTCIHSKQELIDLVDKY
ncbi:helix-turn-helix domain-containing protein [Adlercreutzia caecimuris]|nr:helix-turn-helix transcriptional regulator [Adlercreutzia caecimuris]